MNDEILDWPLEIYGGGRYGEGANAACSHVTETRRPDRRCTAGFRFDRRYCDVGFSAGSIRELYAAVAEHARVMHGWSPDA